MKLILQKLLRAELCSLEPAQLLDEAEVAQLKSAEAREQLYRISAAHDLQHMVGASLYKLDSTYDGQVMQDFKESQLQAALRYTGMAAEQERISRALSEAKIPHILLKGALIRQYYPSPEMRTSCDIDVLIKNEDLDSASATLVEKLTYTKHKAGGHDVQFVSPTGVHLELHFTLAEENDTSPAADILRNVWSTVTPSDRLPYLMDMPIEFAYFYHLAHMVKHFLYGGCGIRTIMDLWIFRHISPLDRDSAQRLICEGNISVFTRTVEELAEAWFSEWDAEFTDPELSAQVDDFIRSGGIYGNTENRVRMNRVEHKSNFEYIISRLFLPYDHMKYDYPILRKYRVLMPFCQMHRWLRLLSGGTSKRVANELKINSGITEDDQRDVQNMLKKLELK